MSWGRDGVRACHAIPLVGTNGHADAVPTCPLRDEMTWLKAARDLKMDPKRILANSDGSSVCCYKALNFRRMLPDLLVETERGISTIKR